MKKVGAMFFVFLIGISFVLAADDWDSFSGDNSPASNEVPVVNNSQNNQVSNVPRDDVSSLAQPDSDLPASVFTEYFWMAMGVLGIVLLIILFLVYSFFKSPRNRFKK